MTEIQIIYAGSVVVEKISTHSQWPPTSERLISSAETLKKRRLSSVCASPISPKCEHLEWMENLWSNSSGTSRMLAGSYTKRCIMGPFGLTTISDTQTLSPHILTGNHLMQDCRSMLSQCIMVSPAATLLHHQTFLPMR